jgi:hypothetical protein
MNRSDPRYIAAVKKVRADPVSRYCFVSGREIPPGGGDPHHVLPVSTYPELATEARNIVIVYRRAHDILTEDRAEKMARLPRIHNLLARMRELDPHYYETFKNRIYAEFSKMDGLY